MPRDAFAAQIGIAYKTLQQVELGYQRLGDGPRMRAEALARGERVVMETPGTYAVPGRPEKMIDTTVRLLMDKRLRGQAAAIAETLDTDEREALRIMVRREFEKEGLL